METADVIVIGLGAVGAATTYQLARRGVAVIGIDRFSPPHTMGSTHGDTRITRQAIGEGSDYVPFALRSNQIWRELERETGADLLTQCGGLWMTRPGPSKVHHRKANFVGTTIDAARQYGIEHEVLKADEIAARFPQFGLVGDELGYFEAGAGFLRPEAAVAAQLGLAERLGATVRRDEVVHSCKSTATGVMVTTNLGTYQGGGAVLSAGAWVGQLLGRPLDRLFTVERQALCWYSIGDSFDTLTPGPMPVFIWEFDDRSSFYGFPAIDGPDGGLKVASEATNSQCESPDTVRREVAADEPRELFERVISGRLPNLTSRCLRAVSCLYTVTPDGHFVIDRNPDAPNVFIASPCSGHGFEHSAAVGETMAQLALHEVPSIDITAFSLARFDEV